MLRERFGFTDVAEAERWLATVLARHWAVAVRACTRMVVSERNALAWLTTDRGPLLAKWSVAPERFARLGEVARLTTWLAERGLPVSAPLPALAGGLQLEVDAVSLGLQRVVAGELLDVAEPRQVRAAGAVLARLHDTLSAYDEGPVLAVGEPDPLVGRVGDELGDLGGLPRGALPVQLVHGDVRSANVLCAGTEVVAVLDLEEARRDHPVVELARSAVLLGTRYRDWGPVSTEVRAGFRAGYESVRPLTELERRWWPLLELWQTRRMVPAGPDPTGWGPAAAEVLAADRSVTGRRR